jgi:preprotein translocase subunit SecE
MEKDKAPQKQEAKVAKAETPANPVVSWWRGVTGYFEDLRNEMRRVTWPTWTQVRATTAVVIFSVFAFAAYFTVVDFFIERGISKVFQTFTTR